MSDNPLPLSPKQAEFLRALSAEGRAIFHRKADNSFTIRGRNWEKTIPVPEAHLDVLIHHGYIGRQDQRAVWFITERGKIALEEYVDGNG